jgi:hypothetical protein
MHVIIKVNGLTYKGKGAPSTNQEDFLLAVQAFRQALREEQAGAFSMELADGSVVVFGQDVLRAAIFEFYNDGKKARNALVS